MGTATQPALDVSYDADEHYVRALGEEASWEHSIDQGWERVFDPAVRYDVLAAWFVERNKSWCYRLPENIEQAARELAKTTLPLELFEHLPTGRMMIGSTSQFQFSAMYIIENTPSSLAANSTPVEREIYSMFIPRDSGMSGFGAQPTYRDIILDWAVSARIVLHEMAHWIDDQLIFGGHYSLQARGVPLATQDRLAGLRSGMEEEHKRVKKLHDTKNPVRIVSRYALLDSCEWFAESLPKYVQKLEEYEENKRHWPATWELLDYIFKEKIFV